MKIEDVFYKLRPIRGKQLDLLWQEYLVAEPPLRKTIEKVLRVQLAQELGETFESEQVLLKPPPEDVAKGDYSLGAVHYGTNHRHDFGLREAEFIQHVAVFGRSGSGKTNLAYLLLKGLVRAGKPFLVFDWKRNYRDLLDKMEFADILVFTVGRDIAPFRFNPLMPPPGTPASIWLKKLIEVACHAYYLGEGVSVLLLRALDSLYREHGVYGSRPESYPTLADVRQWLHNYRTKGRESGWMESTMRAVETLCFGEVGRVLNKGPFFNIAELLTRRAVLELDALTNADKTFLIEALLLWIHHFRLAQRERETFKHAIVIEEAHHVLLRKKQEATGEETVTDVLLREIRELGESIICLDQHPSLISKPALGNTYATFTFNLKHRGDLAMMQDCLLLDSEQTGYLGRLEVGWAVVKLQGRWFWPFLVRVPLVGIEKGVVTDARLREAGGQSREGFCALLGGSQGSSRAISTQDVESGPPGACGAGTPAIRVGDKEGEKDDGSTNGDRCTIDLTTNEEMLLKDIGQNASSGVTERYERLGLSVSRGHGLQQSLCQKNLIVPFFVFLPRGRKKTLVLTEQGKRALGIDGHESRRHGGPAHRYWVKAVAESLRARGYKVSEETPVGGGKTVDVVAEREGRRIAYEIETGASDVSANIKKCRGAGFDEIFVVFTSPKVRDRFSERSAEFKSVHLVTTTEVCRSPLQTERRSSVCEKGSAARVWHFH